MFFLCTISFVIFQKIFFLIIPGKFHESINLIWYLLIGQIIFMGTYFATIYLQFTKKTFSLMLITTSAANFNILLNILLIPIFRINGCLIANLISYTFYLAIIILYSLKVQKESYLSKPINI